MFLTHITKALGRRLRLCCENWNRMGLEKNCGSIPKLSSCGYAGVQRICNSRMLSFLIRQFSTSLERCFMRHHMLQQSFSRHAKLPAVVPSTCHECSVNIRYIALRCQFCSSQASESALLVEDASAPVKAKGPVIEPEISSISDYIL